MLAMTLSAVLALELPYLVLMYKVYSPYLST
jgi:hypothetical protein